MLSELCDHPMRFIMEGSKTNTIIDEIYLLIYIGGNLNTLSSKSQIYQISEAVIPPPMVFNSSSLRSENPISRELKLNLFNELVELVRKMWAILSGRIPEWLILAETNLWEYFEDVRIGDGGATGGRGWVDGDRRLEKDVEALEDKQQ